MELEDRAVHDRAADDRDIGTLDADHETAGLELRGFVRGEPRDAHECRR
jgi:hypothetical protein